MASGDPLVIGQRVYWTDPDPDGNSGDGTIVEIRGDGDNLDDDTIIVLDMDDGGYVEALPHEIDDEMVDDETRSNGPRRY